MEFVIGIRKYLINDTVTVYSFETQLYNVSIFNNTMYPYFMFWGMEFWNIFCQNEM